VDVRPFGKQKRFRATVVAELRALPKLGSMFMLNFLTDSLCQEECRSTKRKTMWQDPSLEHGMPRAGWNGHDQTYYSPGFVPVNGQSPLTTPRRPPVAQMPPQTPPSKISNGSQPGAANRQQYRGLHAVPPSQNQNTPGANGVNKSPMGKSVSMDEQLVYGQSPGGKLMELPPSPPRQIIEGRQAHPTNGKGGRRKAGEAFVRMSFDQPGFGGGSTGSRQGKMSERNSASDASGNNRRCRSAMEPGEMFVPKKGQWGSPEAPGGRDGGPPPRIDECRDGGPHRFEPPRRGPKGGGRVSSKEKPSGAPASNVKRVSGPRSLGPQGAIPEEARPHPTGRDKDTVIGKGFTAQMQRGVKQHGNTGFVAVIQRGFAGLGNIMGNQEESEEEEEELPSGPMAALDYEAFPGDPIDRHVEWYAHQLPKDMGSELIIERLQDGEYSVDGRRVHLKWHPASNQREQPEVFVYGDELQDAQAPVEPLKTFLQHSAAVCFSLKNKGSQVAHVPVMHRLSFPEAQASSLQDSDADARYNAMCIARDQAAAREKAAEQWRSSNPSADTGGTALFGGASGSSEQSTMATWDSTGDATPRHTPHAPSSILENMNSSWLTSSPFSGGGTPDHTTATALPSYAPISTLPMNGSPGFLPQSQSMQATYPGYASFAPQGFGMQVPMMPLHAPAQMPFYGAPMSLR